MAIVTSFKQGINDLTIKRNIDTVIGGLNILNIEYDSNQNATRIDYENNIKMYLTYDANNNCTSLEVVDQNNTTIEKWIYTYNTQNLLKTATRVIG